MSFDNVSVQEAKSILLEELRQHALIVGQVTLASGKKAEYYVDTKRAILRPRGFQALAILITDQVDRLQATAVGGLTMGADPVACAALAGGAQTKAFFVRKETKAHGLQRRIEGPLLDAHDRCLIVEDVVTTGGSTLQALDVLQEQKRNVVGVVTVVDRLAGGGQRIAKAASAPYTQLFTIDELYPDRPDRF